MGSGERVLRVAEAEAKPASARGRGIVEGHPLGYISGDVEMALKSAWIHASA
jgi:hypothetical protein